MNNEAGESSDRSVRAEQPVIVYSRQQLLDLAPRDAAVRHDMPADVRRRGTRRRGTRRRGTRAGVRVKMKQGERTWKQIYRPAVPSVTMGSVRNNTEALETLIGRNRVFQESSLMCYTGAWLTDSDTSSVDGFLTIRGDTERGGGGLALLVNNLWCNPTQATVRERLCTADIELLAVSLRPYYLPREFTVVVAIVVYIPPSARADTACDVIHTTVARLQARYPESFLFLSGDFNHASLSSTLPSFTQFVDRPTRGGHTLDHLYANVVGAYKCIKLPPLAEHNLIHLYPTYTPVVKRLPFTTTTVKCWSREAKQSLQDCLELTDWGVFYDSYGDDIEGLSDCISDYIQFCEDINVPSKEIRCFPNNKPWVTSSLKRLLNEKKRAMREGDRDKVKAVQKELKVKIKEAKQAYSKKMEDELQQDDRTQVTGVEQRGGPLPDGDQDLSDGMNVFVNRFDRFTPYSQPSGVLTASSTSSVFFSPPPYTNSYPDLLQLSHPLQQLRLTPPGLTPPNAAYLPFGCSSFY